MRGGERNCLQVVSMVSEQANDLWEELRVCLGRRVTIVYTSICACHPCAGAMPIFSVSFQI